MRNILDPSLGFCNPPLGLSMIYFLGMTGKQAPKCSGTLRKAFSKNVKEAMERAYPLSPNKTRALSVEAGIAFSTVQRVVKVDNAPTLDTVEAICAALKIPVSLMLQEDVSDLIEQQQRLSIGTIKPSQKKPLRINTKTDNS